MNKIRKLEQENKALRETCEILSDEKVMREIKDSLEQIRKGKFTPLNEL